MGDNGLGPLLLLSYDQLMQNHDHGNVLNTHFHQISDLVNRPLVHSSFCSGLVGLGWLINHLIEIKIIDKKFSQFLVDVDKIAIYNCINLLKSNKHDFLHGATGNCIYLLSRLKKLSNPNIISDLILQLIKTSCIDLNGMYWIDDPAEDGENLRIINLGLAHGLASKIVLLSNAVRLGLSEEKIRDSLKRCCDFLLSAKKKKLGRSFYPDVLLDNDSDRDSRMAWCYGDLGIGIALWRAGDALNNTDIQNQAVNLFKMSIGRRKPEQTSIVDAGICHGTVGIALMYNRMYMSTGIKSLKDESNFWLWNSCEYANFNDGIGGFKTKYSLKYGGWQNDSGLLEGASGIALGILSCLENRHYNWDQCLLLS